MSAKDRPPSFQFYPRNFLTSQKVAAMSLEQIGAYVLLLCNAWLSDQPGTLPDDQHLLSALARANGRWPDIAQGVLSAWDRDGGRIVQRFMVDERAAQKMRHQRSVQGGKSRARAARDSKGRLLSSPTPPLASASASAFALDTNKEKTTHRRSAASRDGYPYFPQIERPEAIPEALWRSWCDFRAKKPKRAEWTVGAAEGCIRKLARFHQGGCDLALVIENSIVSGWPGLYEARPNLTVVTPVVDKAARAKALLAKMEAEHDGRPGA